ncbi:MAG: hypothetical protein LBJ39_05935, partial [Tannerellaceae bacterium]|nr:hypothetical protein [Tannerellaceae bacterium]
KLLKNVSLDADYSCREVIFDFRTDSVLIITSDDAAYPSGEYTYRTNGPLHIRTVPEPSVPAEYADLMDAPFLPPAPNLSIDGKEMYCNVETSKMVFLFKWEDLTPKADKVFIRIE